MFERFTDRARRVVVLAQEEARELGHNYIGTEHILLGLIREGGGIAARALEALGIRLEAVRLEVQAIIGKGPGMPAGHIPFTPRAKKVLELSLREALQLGHNHIGTEHILLGLLREGEGVAAQVLVRLGADLSQVRQQVIQLLHGVMPSGERPDVPGEGVTLEQTFRSVASTHQGPPVRVVGSRVQMESLMARIGEVVSRLDVIAQRLAAIEGHLAEGRRPPARAARKPSAVKKPKPPPAEPPRPAEEGPPAAEAE
jgi:ATP-dependent Clp protease ATP-binding subunit ClpC